MTQDPRLLEAHDAAVTAALAHLERFGSTTRVRADGRRLHPDSQGLMIATFRQTTSRADDPQLHTHAVVSAKVQTVDGRWLALDARYLKRYQRMLGGLYQSVLRSELVDRLGVAWGPIVNGQAEIAGMPAELLEMFSKRSSQVDTALAVKLGEFRDREGRDPTRWERAALTREASVDTRGHKTGNGVTDLQTRWTAEAAALGWTAVDLVDSIIDTGRELNAEPTPRVTTAQVVEALSVGGSTWNRADVIRALCDVQRPLPGMPASRWAQTLERVCDAVTRLVCRTRPGRGGGAAAGLGWSVVVAGTGRTAFHHGTGVGRRGVRVVVGARRSNRRPATIGHGGARTARCAAGRCRRRRRRPRPAGARCRAGRDRQDHHVAGRRGRSRSAGS